MSALDLQAMHRVNTAAVLDVVYRNGALPLSRISQLAGLSRRTVDLILGNLEREGWVAAQAAESVSARRGRPPRSFSFRPQTGGVLAVDIAHDRTTATLADLRGRELATAAVEVPEGAPRADRLRWTRETMWRALAESPLSRSQLTSVVLATPGNVNDAGAVDVQLSMRDWAGFSLAEEFAADFDCPVLVENDARLAALGELWQGATQGADHILWVRLEGPHLGLGIVVDGRLHRGHNGAAGEVSWATALGFHAIADSSLMAADRHSPDEDARRLAVVAAGARAGDEAALDAVARLADVLSAGLSALAWAIAPRFLVLGGTVGAGLAEVLVTALTERLAVTGPPSVEVRASTLGARAATVGAVRMGLDRFQRDVLLT